MPLDVDAAFLSKTRLFAGAAPHEVEAMLTCLGATVGTYGKGARIYRMGDRVSALGLVLSGRVLVQYVDAWGNASVLSQVGPGEVFAEVYAALPDEPLMVDVVAVEPVKVLFLKVSRVLGTCSSACVHHQAVIRNLLDVIARRSKELSLRTFIVAPKTIRGKLLAYLSYQAGVHRCSEFDIPFNRQQLADYLGVDRSAMSAELSRMRDEGILRTNRSHFELLDR